MLAGRVGQFKSTILKLRELSSSFYRHLEKKISLSGSVINQGGYCNIKYSQAVVAIYSLPMLNSARGSFPLAAGLHIASAN